MTDELKAKILEEANELVNKVNTLPGKKAIANNDKEFVMLYFSLSEDKRKEIMQVIDSTEYSVVSISLQRR